MSCHNPMQIEKKNASVMYPFFKQNTEQHTCTHTKHAPMQQNHAQTNKGVYSSVYFHLIMTFPQDYPDSPPEIFVCTPIGKLTQHPKKTDKTHPKKMPANKKQHQ